MNKLSPSILAADFLRLGIQINTVDTSGADYIHIDVMDGNFVPNISFGIPIISAVRRCTGKELDVHLMIEHPEHYIEKIAQAGADIITVHYETCPHLDRVIQIIKENDKKVGVAINPATPVHMLKDILHKIDMVLIMSVNPGYGGQCFIEYSIDKIRELRSIVTKRELSVDIEVDGGITLANVEKVLQAGANIIVAGSAVFNEDTEKCTKIFLKIIKKDENNNTLQ